GAGSAEVDRAAVGRGLRDDQRAVVDGGVGVRVGAAERERAGGVLRHRAGPADAAGEGQVVSTVEVQRGADYNRTGAQRAARSVVADLERTAVDRGGAGVGV